MILPYKAIFYGALEAEVTQMECEIPTHRGAGAG